MALAHWTCDELGVMARVAADRRRVAIDWNGSRMTLSADRDDARRYAHEGTWFEPRHAAARLQLAGDGARTCVPAVRASPWNAALLRGVAFRAAGNEPGWFVEVGGGGTPTLRATLDHGEREIVVARSQRSGDAVRGVASGEEVLLEIARISCEDGMSGQRFDAQATLRVGRHAYTGCGAFLDD